MTGNKEEQAASPVTSPDSESNVPPTEPSPAGVIAGTFVPHHDDGPETVTAAATPVSEAEPALPGASVEPPRSSGEGQPDWSAPIAEPRQSNLVPAVLGVVLLLLAGAVAYLFSTMPDASRIAAVASSIADLRKQVADLAARPQTDPTALTQRLDAVEAEVKGLKAALTTVQAKADAPPPAPVVAAPTEDLKPQIEDLAKKVTAAAETSGQIQQQTAGLAEKLGTADSQVAALKTSLDGLDKRFGPIEAELAAAKSADRVTEVRQNGSAAETRAAPLAVTAQAVLRAVDAGQPFTQDFAVLKTLGADPAALERLKDVADTGAPTTKDLRAALATLREQMTKEAAPTPSGSYMDRLMAGAATLVQVRPLGSVLGDSPAAVVARMDDDLARDDLAAALDEWQKLPEASRTAGKGLAERIRLRQSAQTAAKTIGGNAIKAMATAQQ